MRRTKYVDQAVRQATSDLAQVALAQEMLHLVQRHLQRSKPYGNVAPEPFALIYKVLNKQHQEITSRLLLLGHLLPEEGRREVIGETLEYLGRERQVIMNLLEPYGNLPGMWNSQEEKAFRNEIRIALHERLGVSTQAEKSEVHEA